VYVSDVIAWLIMYMPEAILQPVVAQRSAWQHGEGRRHGLPRLAGMAVRGRSLTRHAHQ